MDKIGNQKIAHHKSKQNCPEKYEKIETTFPFHSALPEWHIVMMIMMKGSTPLGAQDFTMFRKHM